MRTMVRLFIGKFAIVTVPIFSFRKTLYKELGKRILQRILWNHIFTCSNDPYFGMRKQRTQIYDYCFLRIIYPSNEVTACWDIAMCGACFSCNSHLHYCPYLFRGIRKRLFLGCGWHTFWHPVWTRNLLYHGTPCFAWIELGNAGIRKVSIAWWEKGFNIYYFPAVRALSTIR